MNLVSDSQAKFPELRELIRVARAYVAGDIHFSYVCAAAATAQDATRQFAGDARVRHLVQEWADMSLRVWPELSRVDNPISEPEYRLWVKSQLSVFEPGGSATRAEQA